MLNLKEERHQFILKKLKQSKSVSVKDLSEEMHVVPMTIRRDLKELEQNLYWLEYTEEL